ncbi:MAG TPA: efflux RND transporter periplasmic adaptor subunit [Kofleriaceae bacterium]|jgi:HlyD family secretion protein|nr:efflux RND transporter periplasmic adaptor subunit [Kofleriaceae bacterium]
MPLRFACLAVPIVAVSAVAYAGYHYLGGKQDGPPRFTTLKVDKGPIVARVTASGTLSALVTVQVGSQVSGRILELAADFNSPVQKDQIIAKLDPELFQAAVDLAKANLLTDQGNLEKAKVQATDADRIAKRSQEMFRQKLIAEANADTDQANADAARANVTAMKGQVERDRAALAQAETNRKYTVIKSPISGTVISRNVDVGQTVAASLQAPILFTIAEDLKKMQVDTSVAEADVGKLVPGVATTFTVDAFPGEHFRGMVRQIRNAATTVQNVVTYDAVIDVENQLMTGSSDFKLRPGMTANVTFIYAQNNDALRIPNAALRFHMGGTGGSPIPVVLVGSGSAGYQRTVWVLRAGQPVAVPIKTGITDGTYTEVVQGELHEGDDIITEAPDEPTTGQSSPALRF